MMRILCYLLNPAAIGLISVFLSVIWMLRDERDKTRPVLVMALVINLFYGFLLNVVMGQENGLVPWKYDHVLAGIDASLGLSASTIALSLQGGWRLALLVVYNLMLPMMIAWYIAGRYRGGSGSIVLAYIAEMLAGPLLYAILPACGPLYAFRAQWLHPPAVHPELIRLSGMPNAFPSLHLATALVFVFFSRGTPWRLGSLAMLAGTALATLSTGEHYIIDLVAGIAFGCFAANVGYRRIRAAALYLALALCWSLGVRFQFQFLTDHAVFLRFCAVLTVLAGAAAIAKEWIYPAQIRASNPVDAHAASCDLQPSFTTSSE